MNSNPDIKKLQIKMKVLKRIRKEYDGYQVEENKQRAKIDQLVQSNAAQETLNRQNKVLDETISMYSNVFGRLKTAILDLEDYLNLQSDSEEINSSEDKIQSLHLIQESNQFLKEHCPAI